MYPITSLSLAPIREAYGPAGAGAFCLAMLVLVVLATVLYCRIPAGGAG